MGKNGLITKNQAHLSAMHFVGVEGLLLLIQFVVGLVLDVVLDYPQRLLPCRVARNTLEREIFYSAYLIFLFLLCITSETHSKFTN